MRINRPIFYSSLFYLMIVVLVSVAQSPQGLPVGSVAPDIQAKDQFGQAFDLEDQLKNGSVVLMFYRGHWCKYCNKQLEELNDSLVYILDKGASVIAVTPEVAEFVDETSQKYNNSFRIISDTEMTIMNDYKVRFQVDGSTTAKYKIWGIHLDEFNGANGTNLPVPATYIIDKDGRIKYVFFNEDYKKRVSVNTILDNL